MRQSLTVSFIATARLDEEGYLLPFERWDRATGELIARGIVRSSLTEEHWTVVDYLREYYVKFGTVPPVPKLCRDTGFNLRGLYRLFPAGLARGACKIAGIPSTVFRHPLARLYP